MKRIQGYRIDAVMLGVLTGVFLVFYHLLILGLHLMVHVRAMKERFLKAEETRRRRIEELVAVKKVL